MSPLNILSFLNVLSVPHWAGAIYWLPRQPSVIYTSKDHYMYELNTNICLFILHTHTRARAHTHVVNVRIHNSAFFIFVV